MELDVLHSLTASPSVIANFPALAQCIANKELPHGADIIVGIHKRFLKQLYPFLMIPAAPLPSSSGSPEPARGPTAAPSKGRKGRGKKKVIGKQVSQASPRESVSSSSASPAV